MNTDIEFNVIYLWICEKIIVDACGLLSSLEGNFFTRTYKVSNET